MIRRVALSTPLTPALRARFRRLTEQTIAEFLPLVEAAPNMRVKELLAAQASSLLVARFRAELPARVVN